MPQSTRALSAALKCAYAAAGRRSARPDDSELLARFTHDRDEEAFAELVCRHGPLVLGVARRRLADRQAAEDVVQRTFLALARHAGRLRSDTVLSAWLHTVAYRLARDARSAMVRRHALQLHDLPMIGSADPLTEVSSRESIGVIDAELTRLPYRYRLPLILCGLEGRTRDEAAARLGWTLGSVRGRLERGRALLRRRLMARGLSVPVVLAGELVASPAEAMPAALLRAVTRAGIAVPPTAMPTKALIAAAVFLAVLGVGTGAALQSETQKAILSTPAVPLASGLRTDLFGDPLPAGAVARMGSQGFFHGDGTTVTALAISPDGRMVAIRAPSGVHLWDAAKELPVPAAARSACVFATRERLLAVASQGGSFRWWDLGTGREWAAIRERSQPGEFGRFEISPDGTTLVSAEWDYGDRLYRIRLRSLVNANAPPIDLPAPTGQVYRLAFAADGATVVACCLDSSVYVWDVPTRTKVAAIQIPAQRSVLDVAVSPDGRTVAVGTENGLQFFESRGGKRLPDVLNTPTTRVEALSFSPDGRTMALSCDGISLWDLATHRRTQRLRDSGSAYHTAFSADGRTVVAVDRWAVCRWEVASGRRTPDLGHTAAIWTVGFTPDGNTLLTAAHDGDGEVRAWDPVTGRGTGRWVGHEIGVTGIAVTSDGRRAVTGSLDGTIRVWNVATGREIRRIADGVGVARSLCLSPNGTILAAVVDRRLIRLWDLESGRNLRTMYPVGSYCAKIVFRPDDRSLIALSTGGESNVEVFNPVTGLATRRIPVGPGDAQCLGIARDGRNFATGSSDGAVAIWDSETGRLIRQFAAPIPPSQSGPQASAAALAVAMSRDGRCAAAGYGEYSLRVWEVASGQIRARYDGHRGAVLAVAYSPDGTLLATGSNDRTILTWDVAGRRLPGPIVPPSEEALATLWDDLSAADAGKAYQAILSLEAAGDRGVRAISRRLAPTIAADAATTATLLAGLDDGGFPMRERATAALENLGPAAESALTVALAGRLTPGARRRAAAILERLDPARSPEVLRSVRAVEILEHIATPAAHDRLKALAGGSAGTSLTRLATEAVKRLELPPARR